MEQADKEIDFTKQLQNKVRNWRKKLDNIKQKEQILKKGGELKETQQQLVSSKDSVQSKLEEAENILKMYNEYQAKKVRQNQIPAQQQPLLESVTSLIQLIHATYFLRYLKDNQSDLQQQFQSEEAQALLAFGNKILPFPSEGISYSNLLQCSLDYAKDFVQNSGSQIPNTELTYKQIHEVLGNVGNQLQNQLYPALHINVEIREVIKEIQVPVPVPVPSETPEKTSVQQEFSLVQLPQEEPQQESQQPVQETKQQEVQQVVEEVKRKEEQVQQVPEKTEQKEKSTEVQKVQEDKKTQAPPAAQKGKQYDEEGFEIVTQAKKPQRQKEHQRGEGGNRRRGGNFQQGRGKRGGYEQQQN